MTNLNGAQKATVLEIIHKIEQAKSLARHARDSLGRADEARSLSIVVTKLEEAVLFAVVALEPDIVGLLERRAGHRED